MTLLPIGSVVLLNEAGKKVNDYRNFATKRGRGF